MSGHYFGTDGVRGPANRGRLSPLSLTQLGLAIATVTHTLGDNPHILIGRDTRLSGSSMEAALCAGLTAGGVKVSLLGVVPTPAVGFLTEDLGADFGLMITASHNPGEDNGVKLFGPDGYKIGTDIQAAIEAAIVPAGPATLVAPYAMGEWCQAPHMADQYSRYMFDTVANGLDLSDIKVVLDGANGAGAAIGHDILLALGADLTTIGTDPDGRNINLGVGSTAPSALKAEVIAQGALIGIAFDGDADRVLLVDESGAEIDGDQVIATLATQMQQAGTLAGNKVAVTVMSNIALARHLDAQGISLVRTPVGDRHVATAMREGGLALGGEPSGHFIVGQTARTGDGLAAALTCLRLLRQAGEPASAVFNRFTPAPQTLLNVPIGETDPLNLAVVTDAIAAAEARLGLDGRILVRKSGTEPLLRIMVEAMDADICHSEAEKLAALVRSNTA